MASVTLEFLTPTDTDIVALHIYESNAAGGSFTEIETVTAIGTFPNYISTYTTNLAQSATDWFSIAWENAGGVVSPLSQPVQGGTSSLVGIVTDRVMLRDPSLNQNVVEQEAEYAIGEYFNTTTPFSVDVASVSLKTMRGLVTLTLVRSYLSRLITNTQANKWTAGLVSMDTSSGSQTASDKVLDRLLKMANADLNRNYSAVLLAKELNVAGAFKQTISDFDVSRGIISVSID